MSRFLKTLTPAPRSDSIDFGLLFLRLSVGLLMAFGHGWGKIERLFADGEITFADPIGIGVIPSLVLAGGAEFFAALAVALGICTRWMAVPVAITMLVAAFIVHADDPFQKKEFALLFFFPFLTLMFTGPGRFSFDAWLKDKFTDRYR